MKYTYMNDILKDLNYENRNDFLPQIDTYTNLTNSRTFNTWDKTVILASSSNWDGWRFSIWEHMYGKYVSQYLKTSSKIHETFSINPRKISIKLQATAKDLFNVIHDRKVENIILVWHASYDKWVSRSWLVDSYDISLKATDHLKKWFFINAWCALIDPGTFFPLWALCMKDWKKLVWARRWWKMWFDDIKKHRFYNHPVFIHEYFTYYGMMRDDVEDAIIQDAIIQEQNQMKEINDFCKQLSWWIPKTKKAKPQHPTK